MVVVVVAVVVGDGDGGDGVDAVVLQEPFSAPAQVLQYPYSILTTFLEPLWNTNPYRIRAEPLYNPCRTLIMKDVSNPRTLAEGTFMANTCRTL